MYVAWGFAVHIVAVERRVRETQEENKKKKREKKAKPPEKKEQWKVQWKGGDRGDSDPAL